MKGSALNIRVEIYFLPAPRSKGAKVFCITPKWNGLPDGLLQLDMLKADVGGVSAQEADAKMGDLEESHLSVEEMGLRGLCNMTLTPVKEGRLGDRHPFRGLTL